MNLDRPGPASAGAGVARAPQLGTRRLQLWQCATDLSWQPFLEPACRKCDKPRETVGIPPSTAQNRAGLTGDAK